MERHAHAVVDMAPWSLRFAHADQHQARVDQLELSNCEQHGRSLVAPSPTSAAAVSAAATATAAATTATTAFLAGPRFVDGQRAPAHVLAVERRDGRLSLLIAAHLDEAEALRAAGVAIHDDLGRL